MKCPALCLFSLSLLGFIPVRGEEAVPEPVLVAQETAPASGDDIEITVTGTRTPRELIDSPGSITIIKREDLQLNLVGNPRDLLKYEPNISTTTDPRFGFRSINIRGITGNRVLLQVDGIRQPREFNVLGRTLRTGRNFFDLGTVNRVEVLRGGGSALYGSDALGGVVTFTTIDPQDLLELAGKDDSYEFSTSYDSRNRGFTGATNLAFRSPDQKAEGLVSFTRRDFTELQRNNVPERFLDRESGNSNAFLGKLVFRPDRFSRLTFTGEVLSRATETFLAEGNIADGTNPVDPAVLLSTSFSSALKNNRSRFSLAYEFDNPDSNSFIQTAKLLLYYQPTEVTDTTLELRRSSAAVPTADLRREGVGKFIDRIGGVDLQLGSNFETGEIKHRLTYGTELSWQRNERPRNRVQVNIRTGQLFPPPPQAIPELFPLKDFPDSDTFRFGFYLQDEISIGSVSLIPGIRFDAYDLQAKGDEDFFRNQSPPPANFSSTSISPRVGLVWRASPELSVFAQYSRGFRAPAYDEINSGFANLVGPAPYVVIPNPNLQAETSDNFEIGMRSNFDRGRLSLVGFYNLYNNFIVSNQFVGGAGTLANPTRFQALNIQNARIYGIEAAGEYRFSPTRDGFSLFASAGLSVGDDTDNNQPLTTIDPFKTVAGLRYRAPTEQWGVDLTASFVGRARVPEFVRNAQGQLVRNTVIVPDDYITVDLTSFIKFTPQLTLNLGIFNLFNTKYFEYTDLRDSGLVNTSPAQLARADRYAQPGTSFAASLNWRF